MSGANKRSAACMSTMTASDFISENRAQDQHIP
jgi:hypothetical protein